MERQRCKDCRWFLRYPSQDIGQCRRYSPTENTETGFLEVNVGDWCGEWADKNITPQQHERRELVRRFAVAIVAGDNRAFSCEPTFVWQLAEQYVDAEEQT